METKRKQYFTGMAGSVISLIPDAVCDVCGLSATVAERDLQEVESDGPWKEFVPKGEWRFGCYNHRPEKGKLLPIREKDPTQNASQNHTPGTA